MPNRKLELVNELATLVSPKIFAGIRERLAEYDTMKVIEIINYYKKDVR